MLFTPTPSTWKLFEFWRVPFAVTCTPFSTLKMLSVAPGAPVLVPGKEAEPPLPLKAPSPKTPGARRTSWYASRENDGRLWICCVVMLPEIRADCVSMIGSTRRRRP